MYTLKSVDENCFWSSCLARLLSVPDTGIDSDLTSVVKRDSLWKEEREDWKWENLRHNHEIRNQVSGADDEDTDENIAHVGFDFFDLIFVSGISQQWVSLHDNNDHDDEGGKS